MSLPFFFPFSKKCRSLNHPVERGDETHPQDALSGMRFQMRLPCIHNPNG
jgi:hypothetical protein